MSPPPSSSSKGSSSKGSASKSSASPAKSSKSSASQPGPAAPRPGDGGQPSWPRVIATTVQLWLQRRVLGGHDTPAGRRPRLRRRAGAFGLVIVVFAAGALTVALAQGRSTPAARSGGATGSKSGAASSLSGAALAAAATSRQQAAAWIAAQVSHSDIVSCDPVMCSALQASRFPAGDLLMLGPSATDPMGSQIVVSTTALRSRFGSRLPDVYAPVVIASFGTGATRVDVRVEAPDGSQAYLVAQRADLLARQASGQALLRNKSVHVLGASRQDMASGLVDSRLLLTLAALTHLGHQVYISRFGDAGPGAAAGVPLRMVRISALAAHPGQDGYQRAVLRFLRAQQSPFLAATTVLHLPGHKTVIQIEFGAPSPLGLLGANATP
jgi:hypothetical protein